MNDNGLQLLFPVKSALSMHLYRGLTYRYNRNMPPFSVNLITDFFCIFQKLFLRRYLSTLLKKSHLIALKRNILFLAIEE